MEHSPVFWILLAALGILAGTLLVQAIVAHSVASIFYGVVLLLLLGVAAHTVGRLD